VILLFADRFVRFNLKFIPSGDTRNLKNIQGGQNMSQRPSRPYGLDFTAKGGKVQGREVPQS
jgi:hypothetical protein